MIEKPIVTQLNSSTYTPIVITKSYDSRPVAYFTDDESAFYEAVSGAGDGEALIPEKTGVSIEDVKVDPKTGILLYAKAVSGTPNLVVKVGMKRKIDNVVR